MESVELFDISRQTNVTQMDAKALASECLAVCTGKLDCRGKFSRKVHVMLIETWEVHRSNEPLGGVDHPPLSAAPI